MEPTGNVQTVAIPEIPKFEWYEQTVQLSYSSEYIFGYCKYMQYWLSYI